MKETDVVAPQYVSQPNDQFDRWSTREMFVGRPEVGEVSVDSSTVLEVAGVINVDWVVDNAKKEETREGGHDNRIEEPGRRTLGTCGKRKTLSGMSHIAQTSVT